MDPIYYQVNQTKLTDVTQKTSDNLRLQSNKEAKRKSQANEVDKSSMATDTSSMSDDMLGNMDPDDYGGQGAKQFAQMWKEQLTEEEKQADEEPPEEGESEGDEPEPPEDETAPNKEETEVEGVAGQPEASSVSPPPGPQPAATPAAATPEPVPTAERPPAEEGRAGPGRERSERADPENSEKLERAASAPPVPEKTERRAVTPPTSAAEARKADPKRASLGSLLDFSSGYLIAEEAAWDPHEGEEESAAVEEVPEEVLPEEISILLERLVTGDSSQPTYRKLHQLLSRFGQRVLRVCLEAQAKVYLLPPGEPLLAHPQLAHCGHFDLEGAAYLPEHRLCLVEDACLSEAPRGFHPVFYYFAHLYDHALGGESFASLKSAAVHASYQACLDGSHRFGDLMAAHSPAHYFAQAVESYLAENDCYEPLWTRQDLYDFDRSIYNYIEYMLR